MTILCFALAAAAANPGYAARWVDPAAVVETQPIRFSMPTEFFRGGAKVEAAEAMLLRINVVPTLFIPRDSGPPMFVLGDGACRILTSRILTSPLFNDVVVLCPRPPSAGAALWTTPPGYTQADLTPARARQLLEKAGPPPRDAAKRLSRATRAERKYPDEAALVREVTSSHK
jgi:hypothetical protein